MRPIINTKKHVVQFSLATIASGANASLNIALALAAPVATTPAHITEGSKITAVYVEMWIQSQTTSPASAIAIIEKLPGAANNSASTTEMASLNSYDNKNNVLWTQMGLTPGNSTYALNIIKGWIKIPKSKQRFGLEQSIFLTIFAQTAAHSMCGFAVFKEQF